MALLTRAVQPATVGTGSRLASGSIWPGLGLVVVGTLAAHGLSMGLRGALPASTAAVVLGAVVTNTRWHLRSFHPGTAFAGRRLLRVAIVLLGFQLTLANVTAIGSKGAAVIGVTVISTFCLTLLMGRMLRLPSAQSLLTATGFSICGASAIGAMKEVVPHRREDQAVAVAMVTLLGSLGIFLLPALGSLLGLHGTDFGTWAGASIADVGQTVATADRVPGSASAAIIVKLTRVMLLALAVAGVGWAMRRRTTGVTTGRRPPVVPLFVAGFLGAVVVGSLGVIPHAAAVGMAELQEILTVAALFGLGTGIDAAAFRRTGLRPALLGGFAWVLSASVSALMVRGL